MPRRTIFSSESVTAGHPDKICDQVSDAVVDAFLYLDPEAEVSAECAVATGLVFLAVTSVSKVTVDVTQVARETIADIGYNEAHGFDPATCSVITSIAHHTPGYLEAKRPATVSHQASVFGYACTDTPERMPLPITLAHRVAQRLDDVRRAGTLPYLGPDGKILVAVEFEDRRPVHVHSVIVSTQHTSGLRRGADGRLEADIDEAVLRPVFETSPLPLERQTRILVNPTGEFILGGPRRDAGLTGRKTIADTYGGFARLGGGALSGKDPTHIDRLGAYVARYLARNVVAAGLARQCEIHLSYVIGEPRPLAVAIDTFGTGEAPEEVLEQAIAATMDLRPGSVLQRFSLQGLPAEHAGRFYRRLAAYGHFGRPEPSLPWEREDLAPVLRAAV